MLPRYSHAHTVHSSKCLFIPWSGDSVFLAFSLSSSHFECRFSSLALFHSQVSWMRTGSSRSGTEEQRESGEELLERKTEEEGVACLGYQQQHPCHSQPQAPPFPLLLPRPPPPPGQRGSRRREGEVVAADAAEAVSGARGASFIPLPSLPLFYSSAQAPTEEAAGCGGLHRREAPFPGCCPSPGPFPRSGYTVSPMEPLPTQGQTLRHYTASRPRPRRTHTQPPSSRPQVRTHMPKTAQTSTHAHTYCEDAYRAIHIEEFQCRTDPFLFTHRLRTVHGLYEGLECMVINYSHSRK